MGGGAGRTLYLEITIGGVEEETCLIVRGASHGGEMGDLGRGGGDGYVGGREGVRESTEKVASTGLLGTEIVQLGKFMHLIYRGIVIRDICHEDVVW